MIISCKLQGFNATSVKFVRLVKNNKTQLFAFKNINYCQKLISS